MALPPKKNQYMGVNAHANGWLQSAHKWRSFHANHITDLTRSLNGVLPPGYIAVTEESLQVDSIDPNLGGDPQGSSHPRPDATVFDQLWRDTVPSSGDLAPVGIITPTIDTINPDKNDLTATIVYETADDGEIGRPVVRFEVLSPTNKPPYSGARDYERSRDGALSSKIPLVEIDYLHQQPSMNAKLPDYPGEGSSPYSVTVRDPRPNVYEGKTQSIPFGIDEAIPKFDVPFANGGKIEAFDLGAVYHYTFENSPLLQQKSKYEGTPVDFDTYKKGDQTRILERMMMVDKLQKTGHDLDKEGPFPVDHNLIGYYDEDRGRNDRQPPNNMDI